MMDEYFAAIDVGWWWLAGGFALAALEMVVPGVYLLWLALAAIVTGVLTLATGMGLWAQVIVFGVIALFSVYAARRWLRVHKIESEDPLLNHKADRLVGHMATIVVPIEGGEGRAKLGDSEWIARGPDMEVGSRVVVAGAEGSVLFVEPYTEPEQAALGEAAG